MNENLTQQFANFVQHRAPQDAEAILTNTSSPEIAAQREALAREFVKEQVEPRVDAAYQQGVKASDRIWLGCQVVVTMVR
jgi:conjugal transfer mating pair stabilization protein TraG